MKHLTSFLLVLAATALVVWLWRSEVTENSSCELPSKTGPPAVTSALPPPALSADPNSLLEKLKAVYTTPIQFHGLVLDQGGNPVPGAKVTGSVLDNSVKGTPISTTSDERGRFSIQTRGMSLHLEVSKSGYYRVNRGGKLEPSSQGFYFIEGIGPAIHYSDPSVPDVFQLLKAGNPVALERLAATQRVPRDGTPVSVRLSKKSNVALRIRCHTVEENGLPNARYDWKCEVDVEGGGIQEAVDEYEYDFTAPEGGYAKSAVINMPKSLDVKIWNSRAIKKYWLRFPDNTFARVQFDMHSRGDHYANIEGFRNPTPNTRNLEPKQLER